MPALSDALREKLARRRPLAIDPHNGPAVKRSVHEIDVEIDADSFAAALRRVLAEPDGALGLIDIKRAPDRVGREFTVGERFHGCVRLARLARVWKSDSFAADFLQLIAGTRFGHWLEDALLSDYAEVVEVAPRKVVYRYLEGTPLAGSSTLCIEPLGAGRCRFRVIFEYQERGGLAVSALHRFGLQMHDQVTWIQAERAAAVAGATISASTIPVEYATRGAGHLA